MGATVLNTSSMEVYKSYDLAWLGPIIYPLTFSLCSLSFASFFLLTYPVKAGSKSAPRRQVALIEALIVTLIAVEWIFSICCLVQCIVNFSSREYKGGVSACEAQSVYVSIYVWSALLLTGSILIVASQYERKCFHVEKAMTSIGAAAGIVTIILVLALLVALLPFAGVGNFRFAVDYCQPDLEGTGYGLAFVTSFFAMLLASAASVGVLLSAKTPVTWVESIQVAAKMGAPTEDPANGNSSDRASSPKVSVERIAKATGSGGYVQETEHPFAPTVERGSFLGGLMTPTRSMHIYAGLLLFYALTFWPPIGIYIAASRLEDGEQVATAPGTTRRLYGVQAILLHQGQLFHPLLYGWLLRVRMYRVPFSK